MPGGDLLSDAHWDRIFGRVFASEAGGDLAIGAGRGHPIDIDHLLSSTNALISERKLIGDLQRFGTWIAVEFAVDKVAYLDEFMVFEECQRQQQELGRQPTLRELARVLSVSPETVRKALLNVAQGRTGGPLRRTHARREKPDGE